MEPARGAYVRWQEVVVSNDKGRRVVHYYLEGAGGGADLAVVGREKSVRHMSYAVTNLFLRSLMARPHLLPSSPCSSSPHSPPSVFSFKWRSRREVIDWLSSLVSDPIVIEHSPIADRFEFGDDFDTADVQNSKFPSGKSVQSSKEFQWLGGSWLCRKRRKHYRSFCKNGVTISVHDFVFVMVEENKRLVAYVDDLYEDLRGNNMVVVRWFHKVDEVGIVLPPDANDREIFFSLCLQDFSVECIDGLAAVLSAQHFDQFQNEARHTKWRPYLCRRQIDNDDVKPFDITQLKGYWRQELVRSMVSSPPIKLRFKITRGSSGLSVEKTSDVSQSGSKRKHLLHGGGTHVVEGSARDKIKSVCSKNGKNITGTLSGSALIRKELFKQKLQQQFYPGCHVELLSQDSGIRGCWFRCVIVKRHQDTIKVRYQDIKDPDEGTNLEEWVSLSKVAAPDKLGVHCERPIVRPHRSQLAKICNFGVGTTVDAWWHDGWWEGIVTHKESEGRLHVYFPGESRTSIFHECDLRLSQDWINNKWNFIGNKMDIAKSLLSDMIDTMVVTDEPFLSKTPLTNEHPRRDTDGSLSPADMVQDENITRGDSSSDGEVDMLDLTKHCLLKWSSYRKRKHRRELIKCASDSKKQRCETSSSGSQGSDDSNACGGFVLPKSLTVDHENCKIGGDPLFSTPMALSSLVMSQ